jgi:hypothetical protein
LPGQETRTPKGQDGIQHATKISHRLGNIDKAGPARDFSEPVSLKEHRADAKLKIRAKQIAEQTRTKEDEPRKQLE